MAYAKGKYAIAISDRSGLQFPYNEMVKEWTGAWVHTSEYEPKAPQLMPHEHSPDPQSLLHPRPARVAPDTTRLLPVDPFYFTNGSTTVKVHSPSHGFTTSDTIMFWSATNSGTEGTTTQFQGMGVQGTDKFGVAPSELESASGYTPTPDTSNVTPDGPDLKSNFFTITISSTPTATGYGGGGLVFVGPLTVSA